ncbi:MAG TPA: hypothetical protein VG755_45480 [Nannocystaceae bacterium]|nr:hypothetical protein [Nannocystaceae bacterium]
MRASLGVATILCACAVDPKAFGATAESSDTSAEETGECTDDCAIALEWELALSGAPLRGAIENTGSLLYTEHDFENGRIWLTRIGSDGNDKEVVGEIGPLVSSFTACGDVIATTDVMGGGYRMERLIDGEPDPTWMTATTAHEGGWPAQMVCADDGTIRIVGNDVVDGASTIYLDAIDTGELVATWSRPVADVDEVALLGDSMPVSASADILVWAYTNDYEADLRTAEVIRLGPDLVELETTPLDLGHDHVMPPVPSGDGWLLVGRSDSGAWLQRLDASFAPRGARIVDSAAPIGAVSRIRSLSDGGIVLAISDEDDFTHPQLRRYDAAGGFVASASLGALAEHTEGTTVTALLRDGNGVIVLGIDQIPAGDGVNHILRGWLRSYSFD